MTFPEVALHLPGWVESFLLDPDEVYQRSKTVCDSWLGSRDPHLITGL
ncbi:MAG: hypothetical protein M3315_07765 [Actinomycetota bacterium]|nr:hypothetical protein [Actinomycetota bacterium]